MFNQSRKRTIRDAKPNVWHLIIALGIAFSVRIWILAVTENGIDFHFNAYDRSIFTWYDWMQSARWVPLVDYGPFHYYLLRLVFYVTGYDPYYAPRLLSLVFGVACIWPLVNLTARNFGQKAALFAGLGGAIYPLGVRLSTVSLEMTIFHFFVLISLDALDKGLLKKEGRVFYALLSGLWLTIACATRFEGWLIIPIMTAIMTGVLFLKKSKGDYKNIAKNVLHPVVAFGAMASLFPVFWMIVSYKITGNPTFFASIAGAVQKIHSFSVPFIDRALGWPIIFLHTTTVAMTIIILLGLVTALKKGKGIVPAATGLILFALFVFFAIRGAMALNETKYISTVAMIFIPFFGFGLVWISEKISVKFQTIIVWILMAVTAVLSLSVILDNNRKFTPSPSVKSLCKSLGELDDSAGKVLIGVRYQGYIITHSKLPYHRFVFVPGNDETGQRSEVDFWRIIKAEAPCVLIHNTLPDNLDFQMIIPIDGKIKKKAVISGYEFDSIFINKNWMLLAVKKADGGAETEASSD